MAIRNYTSKKSPAETIGKIQHLLAENSAKHVSMEYGDDATPVALSFVMSVGGTPIRFRLTVDEEGMLRAMQSDDGVPSSKCTIEQARRTAWKNKYDWLHAQMAEIKTNQARIEQLLLGYAVTDNGQTAFDRLQNSGRLLNSQNQQEATEVEWEDQ